MVHVYCNDRSQPTMLEAENTQEPRLAVQESNMLQHIAKPEIPKSRGPHPIQKMPFMASTTL